MSNSKRLCFGNFNSGQNPQNLRFLDYNFWFDGSWKKILGDSVRVLLDLQFDILLIIISLSIFEISSKNHYVRFFMLSVSLSVRPSVTRTSLREIEAQDWFIYYPTRYCQRTSTKKRSCLYSQYIKSYRWKRVFTKGSPLRFFPKN